MLLMLVGIWLTRGELYSRRALPFLLAVSAGSAALLAALLVFESRSGIPFGLAVFLVAPTLGSVLTLLLSRWRSIAKLWGKRRWLLVALALCLALICVTILLGAPSFLPAILALSVSAALLWALFERLSPQALLAVELALAAWLILEIMGAVGNRTLSGPTLTQQATSIITLSVHFLAIFAPARVLYIYLISEEPAERLRYSVRLALALCLVLMVLYNIYLDAQWAGANGLIAEDYYPFLQLFAVLLSGVLISASREAQARLDGPIFTVVISLLIMFTFNLGWKARLLPF